MAGRVSFIGGMNVPAALGRGNATVPLAELVIDDRTLTLRARSLGRLMLRDFDADLDQVAAAFRLRGTIMTSGVGIRRRDGVIAYFWTYTKQDAVLAALSERGIQIEKAQRARAVWSFRDGENRPVLPAMPTLLQTLAPVLVLLGTAIAVVLFIVAGSWPTRLVVVVVWVLSVISALGLWRKGRPRQGR
jgi:hypothetical protein